MPPRLPVDSLAFSLHAAAQAIGAVIAGRNLDAALSALQLPPVNRPAVIDLAFNPLRCFGRSDFYLERLMARPLTDAVARGLLLAALQRLENRPQEAHTIVDQAVSAATIMVRGKYRGLVNAVLRNFLRQQAELTEAADADEVARYRHPHWWLDKLRTSFPARWEDIAAAGNQHPPMTLRVNARRATPAEVMDELAQAGIAAHQLGDVAIRLERPVPVERLPGFAAGRVSVQDFGAQQAALLLDARSGMRVLDACAAPGGKAAHLLELADIDLTALDADARRAARIDENLSRLGLAATVKTADCRDLTSWWDGQPFERILADVPCSASGVARRHPDIKWLRRSDDIAGFAAAQAEILDALWRALAPGGTMLYATCSLFPEENAHQVAAFMARHADAQRLPVHGQPEWQLIPDADQDGFFYARLAKR
ncbi:MAG: 16S rRNA (cytosine(967)-C(5))-methyltransferase RsmB [Zoogloeaceae bacterium]|jgi:16S rRNA (cytosine967-C5)-methyltransferase|nr:16S rRNA (cytosine(967)-C(5))-methyltransferase RsmB [Zoogloeaceae bacterium]